jgi:hypothetical protein
MGKITIGSSVQFKPLSPLPVRGTCCRGHARFNVSGTGGRCGPFGFTCHTRAKTRAVPLIDLQFLKFRQRHHASIVDHNIDAPVRFQREARERLNVLKHRDVKRAGMGLATIIASLLHEFLKTIGAARAEDWLLEIRFSCQVRSAQTRAPMGVTFVEEDFIAVD